MKEKNGIKNLKSPKPSIDYSEKFDDVYENLKYYNALKKREVLIEFNDMIADMESN